MLKSFKKEPKTSLGDFSPISQSESHDNLLAEDAENGHIRNHHKEFAKRQKVRRHLFRGLFIITPIVTFLFGLWLGNSNYHIDADKFCTRQLRIYSSPLEGEVPISYHTQTYNGSFLKENIYRQDASPEVDAAWEALGVNYRPMAIPVEKAAKAGLTEAHVHINPKYGGGYPANLEGLHHLHCLDLTRRALAWNYEYYADLNEGAWQDGPMIVKKHVSHCVDILRQQLMCSPDLSVLGQVWYVNEDGSSGGHHHKRDGETDSHANEHDEGGGMGDPNPFVDFNTKHKCINFDAVRAWAEGMQMPRPEETPPDLMMPPKPEHILVGIP